MILLTLVHLITANDSIATRRGSVHDKAAHGEGSGLKT